MPVKVLDSGGSGELFDLLEDIYYSVDKGADILNLSLEIPSDDNINSLKEAIKFAYNKNRTIVASSGNDGIDSISYLASYPETIAVRAVDLGEEGRDEEYGYGLLDVYGALLGERLKAPYVFTAKKMMKHFLLKAIQLE